MNALRKVVVAFGVLMTLSYYSGAIAVWEIQEPSGLTDLDPSMSVVCSGKGEGATDDFVRLKVEGPSHTDQGVGNYHAINNDWAGDVSASTSWGEGAGTVSVWAWSQNPATDPAKDTQTVNFDDGM